MSIPNAHAVSLMDAQTRAASLGNGEPFATLPPQSLVAALARHGGMYTLLDADLMMARMGAFQVKAVAPSKADLTDLVSKLQSAAQNYFYKLVTDKPGYQVHGELMAYISEPGSDNGITYDEGADPSPHIPAAFTFVGQFIDHDLTFNGMNLTADERGAVVADEASPAIDLDSVYGARSNVLQSDSKIYEKIFDKKGKFILREVADCQGVIGYDVPRNTDVCKDDSNFEMAYIFDPRNDENQIILQIHILVQRLHNKIVDRWFAEKKLSPSDSAPSIVGKVRKEVVATWQNFVLNDYMPAILRRETLAEVLSQIRIKGEPGQPEKEYGDLKHKPLRDLVTGINVVRMPHEFAIGFRFGHSQLRPMYLLNKAKNGLVLLFKDARASEIVTVKTPNGAIAVNGGDDLHGHRTLAADHVIDWEVFYPVKLADINKSLLIDHKVTARVFNLPETTIPDDIKYIGNLPHRNLIRGSQIGVVCGEDLARFYGIQPLRPDQVLGEDAKRPEVRELFELDSEAVKEGKEKEFKTPLWFYLIREGETESDNQGARLGKLGSRLVAEVLAGALYYGNELPYKDDWKSSVFESDKITLRDIIKFVNTPAALPAHA